MRNSAEGTMRSKLAYLKVQDFFPVSSGKGGERCSVAKLSVDRNSSLAKIDSRTRCKLTSLPAAAKRECRKSPISSSLHEPLSYRESNTVDAVACCLRLPRSRQKVGLRHDSRAQSERDRLCSLRVAPHNILHNKAAMRLDLRFATQRAHITQT